MCPTPRVIVSITLRVPIEFPSPFEGKSRIHFERFAADAPHRRAPAQAPSRTPLTTLGSPRTRGTPPSAPDPERSSPGARWSRPVRVERSTARAYNSNESISRPLQVLSRSGSGAPRRQVIAAYQGMSPCPLFTPDFRFWPATPATACNVLENRVEQMHRTDRSHA